MLIMYHRELKFENIAINTLRIGKMFLSQSYPWKYKRKTLILILPKWGVIYREETRHCANTSTGFNVGYFWTYLFPIKFRNPVDCWGHITIEILLLHKSIIEAAVWKWLLYHCAGIYNLSSETMHDRLNILFNLTKISWFTTCVVSLNNYWLVAIGPP